MWERRGVEQRSTAGVQCSVLLVQTLSKFGWMDTCERMNNTGVSQRVQAGAMNVARSTETSSRAVAPAHTLTHTHTHTPHQQQQQQQYGAVSHITHAATLTAHHTATRSIAHMSSRARVQERAAHTSAHRCAIAAASGGDFDDAALRRPTDCQHAASLTPRTPSTPRLEQQTDPQPYVRHRCAAS